MEKDLIRQALARSDNDEARAAKLLHLSPDALRDRIQKLGLA